MSDNFEVRKIAGKTVILGASGRDRYYGTLGLVTAAGLCLLIAPIYYAFIYAPVVVFCMSLTWLTLRKRREVRRYYLYVLIFSATVQTLVYL